MQTKTIHFSKNGEMHVEFVKSDVLEAYTELAIDALDDCRKSIMMSMRFIGCALWHLDYEREPLTRTMATNGRVLKFDPEAVIDRYRQARNELVRDLLHATLHCVFHHPFDVRHPEHDSWSLACDIAVEACAIELCGKRFASSDDEERLEAIERLSTLSRNMTAPALYQVLRSGGPGERLYLDHGLEGADISNLVRLFKRDLHDLWASFPRDDDSSEQGTDDRSRIPDLQAGEGDSVEVQTSGADDGSSDQEGDREPGASEGSDDANPDKGDDALAMQDESGDELDGTEGNDEELSEEELEKIREDWEKIGKKVETEMRSQRRRGANAESNMLLNLAVSNKSPANYDEFLKQFATLTEDMCVNDDEFDYIFYTYGLDRYGNMPLVEPLEYKESDRVREFVIAIDTSESCSGELVKAFVNRTYDILRQQSSFSSEINVHIVQCDAAIKAATKVTSLRQLEEYSESFWISGGGGTDFKPVFEYVDSLVAEGEFVNLKGLVYFTDGYGSFPTKAPDYETAFVFVDAEGMNVRVPPWAMKVLMSEDEVMQR